MLFQIALEKNPVAKTNKEACVAFAAAQDSLCYNFSFRGRWKWPQASRILEEDRWGPREGDGNRISMHKSERSWAPGHSNGLRGFSGVQGDTLDALEGTGQVPRRPAGIGRARLEQS